MPDNCRQVRDFCVVGPGQPGAEIFPECDAEFCAGLAEAEEGVAAVAPGVASCAAADLSLGDLAADVVFRTVGVQWDFGSIEDHQQFVLVGMEPCERVGGADEAGLAREDAVEPCPQGGLALAGRMLAIGFEIAIEPPDQRADSALGPRLVTDEAIRLLKEARALS